MMLGYNQSTVKCTLDMLLSNQDTAIFAESQESVRLSTNPVLHTFLYPDAPRTFYDFLTKIKARGLQSQAKSKTKPHSVI